MKPYKHSPILTYGDQRAVVIREPYWKELVEFLDTHKELPGNIPIIRTLIEIQADIVEND